MRVEQLTLRQFRNVEESTLVPAPRLNFLIGRNGQGKTSFLEALAFLSTLRSFRGSRTDEVIRWGHAQSEVRCIVLPESEGSEDWRTELKLLFEASGQKTSKTAFINGKPFRSSTQYLSQRFGNVELGFHTIVFNPADHDLVRGEPAIRRSYLDRVLAAEDLDYLKKLQKFQRVLEQRNGLLKSETPPSRTLLEGFSEPLVQLGAWVAWRRLCWLKRLSSRLDNVAQQIAPKQPPLRAFYLSKWVPETAGLSIWNNNLIENHFSGQGEVPSLEILEQSYWDQLSSLLEAELRSRSSLVGPHRDDWGFVLGRQLLKGHGSQGEVRTALLSLKLSEIDLFRESTRHRPLLLLDDFSSELDHQRRAFLLQYLAETDLQVFVTTTETSEDIQSLGKRFEIENGKIF